MINSESSIKIDKSTDETSFIDPSKLETVLTEDAVKHMIEEARNEIRNETKQEIERQVQIDRASLLTVFGVFASIIAFLNFEVHFLRTVSNVWDVVGFSCVMSALLISFNIVLDYLMQARIDSKTSKGHMKYVFLTFALFITGCSAIYYGERYKQSIVQDRL